MTSRGACRVAAAGLVAVLGLGVAGCVDGDSVARSRLREAAEGLESQLVAGGEVVSAEQLVARWDDHGVVPLELAPDDETTASVQPLEWRGQAGGGEAATVVVRISVHTPGRSASSIGDTSSAEGDAAGCYRYEVRSWRDTTSAHVRCPRTEPQGPIPAYEPPRRLTDDDWARLEAVLAATSVSRAADDVAAAFEEDGLHTQTAVDGDRVVAAVGTDGDADCMVGVRTADGAVERGYFDPVWAQPGELGCSPGLVLSPPG